MGFYDTIYWLLITLFGGWVFLPSVAYLVTKVVVLSALQAFDFYDNNYTKGKFNG